MTILKTFSRKVFHDRRGAAAMEFALLAPAFLLMLTGVLTIGLQMQSYNALRSIGADVNRYASIEYQKENLLTTGDIQQRAFLMARSDAYQLATDAFDATVTEEATGIEGAKKFKLTMTYDPPAVVELLDIATPRITQTQSIIVAE